MGEMKQFSASSPWIWRLTSVFTGAGCTFLGPFLPALHVMWQWQDRQIAALVSFLFLGSFTGTLSLSSNLRRTLFVGSWTACLGLLLFAFCVARGIGFPMTVASLLLLGFGLGQLMSSINLLVGTVDEHQRAGALAGIAASFCVGAILAPILTTVLVHRVSAPMRLAIMAPGFLLPFLWPRNRHLPKYQNAVEIRRQPQQDLIFGWLAWGCIASFFIYGGVEACVANWMPLFATRYRLDVLGRAQWMTSLFWIGLSSGRIVLMKFSKISRVDGVLRASVLCSGLCLAWLLVEPTSTVLLCSCLIEGVCLGPIFPLLLSQSIGQGLSGRILSAALAACGLGATIFPYLLGVAATSWALRVGMILPLAGLCVLLVLGWHRSSTSFHVGRGAAQLNSTE